MERDRATPVVAHRYRKFQEPKRLPKLSFARTPHRLSRLSPRRAATQKGGERYGRLSRGRTNSGLCLLRKHVL